MTNESTSTDGIDDATRLDWMLHRISGKEMRRLGIVTSGGGPLWGRVAIDAAIAQDVKKEFIRVLRDQSP